jgi:hypothetical protein
LAPTSRETGLEWGTWFGLSRRMNHNSGVAKLRRIRPSGMSSVSSLRVGADAAIDTCNWARGGHPRTARWSTLVHMRHRDLEAQPALRPAPGMMTTTLPTLRPVST